MFEHVQFSAKSVAVNTFLNMFISFCSQRSATRTTCTADVTFAPIAPGLRKGAVELLDGTTVIASTYVYGIGVGPQIGFTPSAQITLGGVDYIGGNFLLFDGAGNIFLNSCTLRPCYSDWLYKFVPTGDHNYKLGQTVSGSGGWPIQALRWLEWELA